MNHGQSANCKGFLIQGVALRQALDSLIIDSAASRTYRKCSSSWNTAAFFVKGTLNVAESIYASNLQEDASDSADVAEDEDDDDEDEDALLDADEALDDAEELLPGILDVPSLQEALGNNILQAAEAAEEAAPPSPLAEEALEDTAELPGIRNLRRVHPGNLGILVLLGIPRLHTHVHSKSSMQLAAQPEQRSEIEVSMEQRRNVRVGETGDPRVNPPTNGIVRHDFHVRKSGRDPAGNGTRLCSTGAIFFVLKSGMDPRGSSSSKVKKRGSDTGDTNTARLVPHRSYAQGVQCFRRDAVPCKLHLQQWVRREHCTPVQSLALSGDGALDAHGSIVLIAPALLGLKRGEKLQVDGGLKARKQLPVSRAPWHSPFTDLFDNQLATVSSDLNFQCYYDTYASDSCRRAKKPELLLEVKTYTATSLWQPVLRSWFTDEVINPRFKLESVISDNEIAFTESDLVSYCQLANQANLLGTIIIRVMELAFPNCADAVTQDFLCIVSFTRCAVLVLASLFLIQKEDKFFLAEGCDFPSASAFLYGGDSWSHYSPPALVSRFRVQLGRSRIFARGHRGGRCRWSAGLSRGSSVPPPFHSGAAPYSPRFALIGSQDLDVKSRTNLFTRFTHSGQRLDCSPPTTANRVPSPAASLRISSTGTRGARCHWSAGLLRGSPVFPALSFRCCPNSPYFTLIGSQDIDAKNCPDRFAR
ncbi:hypothetical protein PR048_024515 [Dryococelus australis]|uniref:Uncharacterized protein n=1 Tax=Dryococelus australis TaxID=614101 RepID=A0ABQ9GNV2_9NEOP|nr:hypothetical protein PR048_024515 [Dryococelus australis]